MTAILRLPINDDSHQKKNIAINQLAELYDRSGAGPRERLTAARTYYVRSDGSNSNDGLTDSAAGAFLTMQKAADVVAGSIDFGGQAVTVQTRSGTFAGANVSPWVGGGSLTFAGDNTTPTNVVLSSANCFNVTSPLPGTMTIGGYKFLGTSSAITLAAACSVRLGNVEFGSSGTGFHINVVSGGVRITIVSNYTISGGAQNHLNAAFGFITNDGSALTCTLTGTPAFSGTFALGQFGGSIFMGSMIYSGAATGVRYMAQLDGIIHTGGGGPNFFPGNAAGTVGSGGQYI